MRNTALNQLRVGGYDFDELVDTLAAADDPGDDEDRTARATHDDNDGEECGADALTAGTTVLEAELKVRDGKAVWKEPELLKP